jgi:hypothetical protein
MANEDKKQELLLTQEILQNQRDITRETEMSYGVLKKNQMARKEVVDLTREVSKFAEEELAFANESSNSLRSKSELLTAQAKNQQLIAKGKILENDLISKMGGQVEKLSRKDQRRLKVLQNQNATNEAIAASIDKQIKARQKLNDELGIADNLLRGMSDIPFLGKFIDAEAVLKVMEKDFIKNKDSMKAMAAAAGEVKNQLKGAAKMAAFVGGLKIAAGFFKFMVSSLFKLSKLQTDLANELGISQEAARGLQTELHHVAVNSGLAYLNAEKLNKALIETTQHTGMMSQTLGTNYLKTFVTLTDRMKIGSKESEKLSFLLRRQSKDTRGLLNDNIGIVNQYNKQNKTAFTARGIIAQVAGVSSEVAVALGMGTEELTKSVLAAASLGTTLDTVSGIADGLLNFEQSMQAELELSLATNQRISLAKERELALNNKLGELAESLMGQEKILKAFREGNRVQMDLAAAAMGVQREVLAEMIMMQDRKMLSEEEFLEIYGEQTLSQIEALDAQEELNQSIEKMKIRLMEAFKPLIPIIEGFSSIVKYITESKFLLGTVLTILGGMAARSITIAIATAYSAALSPMNPANIASLGSAGAIAGSAIAATLYLVASNAEASIPEADFEDGIIDLPKGRRSGIKVNTLPQDTVHIDKGGNKIAVGTNLQGQNMDEVKNVLQNIEDLLRNPAERVNVVEYDSFSKNASDYDAKYKSSFA